MAGIATSAYFELNQPIDQHSKKLIVSNIELFLGYCQRFYDRQFITRDHVNKGILEQFEMFLRGSGFHFSGTLDFVSDEEYYGEIPDFDPPTEEYQEYKSPNE